MEFEKYKTAEERKIEGFLRAHGGEKKVIDDESKCLELLGNLAVPRVMVNRSLDRLKPNLPSGKTLGNLRPFLAKSNPRNDRFFTWTHTTIQQF
jgi:hypothetical protein